MTADARERLTYEQTLQVLVGMVGRDVNVQIAPRDRNSMVPRSGVAMLDGTLHGAVDVVHPTLREFVGEAEALLFAVGSVTSGFIISPGEFESASWWTPAPDGTFVIELVGALVFVNQARRAGR